MCYDITKTYSWNPPSPSTELQELIWDDIDDIELEDISDEEEHEDRSERGQELNGEEGTEKQVDGEEEEEDDSELFSQGAEIIHAGLLVFGILACLYAVNTFWNCPSRNSDFCF